MRLEDVLRAGDITTDMPLSVASDKDATLRELARLISRNDAALDATAVYRALADRERLASTGIGSGVAVPHGRLSLDRPRMALAIYKQGVPFESLDGEPARILLALLTPVEHASDQLKLLGRVSRVLRGAAVRAQLLEAGSPQAALAVLVEEERRQLSRGLS